MWNKLSDPWKESVNLAWEAFGNGNTPIGSVIVDHSGIIISKGMNMCSLVEENHPLSGTSMGHAEMNSMVMLRGEHANIEQYSLYSTMEPCPMCFSTLMMMHIGNLHYGAKDSYAGSVCLKTSTKYLSEKSLRIYRSIKEVEIFQITLQSAYEFSMKKPRRLSIINSWRSDYSKAVNFAEKLVSEGFFRNAVANENDAETIFNEITILYNS